MLASSWSGGGREEGGGGLLLTESVECRGNQVWLAYVLIVGGGGTLPLYVSSPRWDTPP